jgi:hypothetical protein
MTWLRDYLHRRLHAACDKQLAIMSKREAQTYWSGYCRGVTDERNGVGRPLVEREIRAILAASEAWPGQR